MVTKKYNLEYNHKYHFIININTFYNSGLIK